MLTVYNFCCTIYIKKDEKRIAKKAKPKTYEITTVVTEWKRTRMYYSKGTLKELIEATRNTFEAGHKSNPKINLAPKTIKSFASNYKKALYQEGHIAEVTYKEFQLDTYWKNKLAKEKQFIQ